MGSDCPDCIVWNKQYGKLERERDALKKLYDIEIDAFQKLKVERDAYRKALEWVKGTAPKMLTSWESEVFMIVETTLNATGKGI